MTKADIIRLGEKIRKESPNITAATLEQLQVYRTSHKDALSDIFSIICGCARQIRKETIVTYRIKRFESIIGKLNRFPEMKFNRMWDIAGCRCIVKNERDIYRLRDLISSKLYIRKENDYVKQSRSTGYRSLHLYISRTKEDDKIIELQIRSREQHNWATLVEITDFIFDEKLKETESNSELARFHRLLSKKEMLSIEDKHEIFIILKKYNYIEKLNGVFKRNYINVRQQWLQIESKKEYDFFLIEAKREESPKINSYSNFNEAEQEYFNRFKDNSNSNIVLTHLPRASYAQISIAYSNYILTVHQFTDDYNSLIESLIAEALQKKKPRLFTKAISFYCKNSISVIKNLKEEAITISQEFSGGKNRKKMREWIKDIDTQTTLINSRWQSLARSFRKRQPKAVVFNFLAKHIALYYIKNHAKHVRKIVKS